MNFLVTGSNGLVGQYLVKMLTEKKHRVIATGKGPSRLPFHEVNLLYEELDISDASCVSLLVNRYDPDCIIHAAAITQVDTCETNQTECWNINVNATRSLIDAAKHVNAFFIYLSTDFVFDGTKGPYSEMDKRSPVNYYGITKVAAEDAVLESGLDHAIVRTVLVFGQPLSGARANIITWVKEKLEKGESIKVVDDQFRTPTYVKDLAKGIILIAEKRIKGIFHLSGKDLLTPWQMAVQTADWLKLNQSLINRVDASIFSQPALRPPRTGFNIEKARKILGFEPRTFKEGLADMFSQQDWHES